jgi:hypothetical protein
VVLGLELRAYTLSHSTSPFFVCYFQDRVSQTICPGWLRTTVLLIAASQVARIIGVSHWHPALLLVFKEKSILFSKMAVSPVVYKDSFAKV